MSSASGFYPKLLSRWTREAEEAKSKAFGGSGSPRDEEIARLKRERERERGVLREAATFFAKGFVTGI